MNTTVWVPKIIRRNWWQLLTHGAACKKLAWNLQPRHNARGIRVTCSRGAVWVTFANDAQDYIVHAGESRSFKAQDRAVVQGLGDAEFSVE